MKNKPKFAILIPKDHGVTRNTASGYSNIRLHVVMLDDKGSIRNPENDSEFDNLEFSAQWDDPIRYATDRVYGWQVSYRDAYRIELADARRMVKLLERVEKKHGTWTVEANTFGQWLALTAADLGLGCIRESRHSLGSGTYAENDYHTLTLREMQYAVDQAIDAVRHPEKETVQP